VYEKTPVLTNFYTFNIVFSQKKHKAWSS